MRGAIHIWHQETFRDCRLVGASFGFGSGDPAPGTSFEIRPPPSPPANRPNRASGFNESPYPHTSFAVSATRRSLASCSAGVMRLPSIVEAKPHCVLSARRSKGMHCSASRILALSARLDSRPPYFVLTRPRTTVQSSGISFNGPKSPARSSSYSRRKRSKRVRRKISFAIGPYPPLA